MLSRAAYRSLTTGTLIVGLGLIFLFHLDFFPAILPVVGITLIFDGFATGKKWYGLQSGILLIGLSALFYLNAFWPGVLVVLGIAVVVGVMTRPMLRESRRVPPGEDIQGQ